MVGSGGLEGPGLGGRITCLQVVVAGSFQRIQDHGLLQTRQDHRVQKPTCFTEQNP